MVLDVITHVTMRRLLWTVFEEETTETFPGS